MEYGKLIDGKKICKKIVDSLEPRVKSLRNKGFVPHLHIIDVGPDEASRLYTRNKVRAAEKIGIKAVVHRYDKVINPLVVKDFIKKLNTVDDACGIIVQLPLPDNFDTEEIVNLIDPDKDVDGFTYINTGKLQVGARGYYHKPCTAEGIMTLLECYKIPLKSRKVVMVGRSNIVGRPLSSLLEKKDATVTLCHSKTSEQDLINELRSADIIISAVGIPRFIKQSMISFKQTLIDVGINRDEDGKLIGDMDFEDVSQFCNYITPVPGGVGPMTVAMLMQNTVLAGEICYEKKIKKMAHKNV